MIVMRLLLPHCWTLNPATHTMTPLSLALGAPLTPRPVIHSKWLMDEVALLIKERITEAGKNSSSPSIITICAIKSELFCFSGWEVNPTLEWFPPGDFYYFQRGSKSIDNFTWLDRLIWNNNIIYKVRQNLRHWQTSCTYNWELMMNWK